MHVTPLLTRLLPGRRFRLVALAVAIVGATVALWTKRDAALDLDWRQAWWAFGVAVLLFSVPPLAQALAFRLLLRALGMATTLRDAAAVWGRAFLLRYAPSGTLGHLHRIQERRRLGAKAAGVVTAIAYEQLALLVAGALVCTLALSLAPASTPLFPVIALGAAGVLFAAVHPRTGGAVVRRLLERRGIVSPPPLRFRRFAPAVLLVAVAWGATGAALTVLVGQLAGSDAPGFVELTGAYALAWLTGYLLPLLPAGLGVRDATLATLLAPSLGAGGATAAVLTTRLAVTLGELVAIGILELTTRERSRPETSPA